MSIAIVCLLFLCQLGINGVARADIRVELETNPKDPAVKVKELCRRFYSTSRDDRMSIEEIEEAPHTLLALLKDIEEQRGMLDWNLKYIKRGAETLVRVCTPDQFFCEKKFRELRRAMPKPDDPHMNLKRYYKECLDAQRVVCPEYKFYMY